MRILIAEDDAASRAALAGVLKKSGYEVVEATDGAEAWKLLQQPEAPALAILDWIMPEMNGLEVVIKVRSQPTDCPPYLIMLSAKVEKADIIAALEAGANDYLAKPFDQGELRTRVEVGRHTVEMQAAVAAMNEDLRTHQIELEMQNEELRRTQEELDASRTRYFDLYDLAPIGYVTISETGLILEANITAANLLGISRDALVKLRFSRFILNEYQGTFYLLRKQILETNEPQSCELQMTKHGGAPFWARLEASAVRDENGAPENRLVLSDITESKLAEVALRRSEAKLEKIVSNIGDVVALIDQDGITRYKSPNIERLFGWKPAEVVGRGVLDHVHPEDLETVRKFFAALLSEPNATGTTEYRYRCSDGGYRWIEFTGVNLLHDPELHGLLGDYHDLSKRKQAGAERELLMMAIQQAAEIVYITDARGLIQYVNPAFETLTGYSREEVVGKNPRIFHSGQQDDDLYKTMWETLSCGKIWQGVLVNKKKDGTIITEETTISPVHDTAGTIINYVAVKRDITLELSLKAQFDQAQKMESVGRLAGGVAHDFNNMLGVILGYTELALEQVGTDHLIFADLQEIRSAAERSADLTRQLLAFSRQQTIAPKVLDLSQTIAGMLNMLGRLIGEDIKLVFNPGKNLWPTKIDPSQVDQVLVNLCVNARDAIADVGTITIEISNGSFSEEFCLTHAEFLSGDYVGVTVSDTGSGMDKATMEHIFEPFFTTKEMGKGTGLGLATVYGIIKQNRGFISVRSEEGVGTSFTIYLVRHVGNGEQEQAAEAAAADMRGLETILLVEDEPAILSMTKVLLERQGYSVLAAGSPGQAIQLAKEHGDEIHLLMTDVVMPEMNGRELAKNLQALYPKLQLLFMSGYTANVIDHHGVLDSDVYFIQKPFSMRDLAATIRKALDHEDPSS